MKKRMPFFYRSCCALLVCATAGTPVDAGTVAETKPITLVVDPSADPLWGTMPDGAFELTWRVPEGASEATLSVEAQGFSYVSPVLTTNAVAAEMIPAAAVAERVYGFRIAFDDGTVRTARLARVRHAGVSTATCSLLGGPTDAGPWNVVSHSPLLLPVPDGADGVAVNGLALDVVPACRWCEWKPRHGPFRLVAGDAGASLRLRGGLAVTLR